MEGVTPHDDAMYNSHLQGRSSKFNCFFGSIFFNLESTIKSNFHLKTASVKKDFKTIKESPPVLPTTSISILSASTEQVSVKWLSDENMGLAEQTLNLCIVFFCCFLVLTCSAYIFFLVD